MGRVAVDRYLETVEECRADLEPLIVAAIEDAGAEIDGYLAGRYPMPHNPVPRVICKSYKDMAVYNLISRAGLDEQGAEKNFRTRYNSTVKFLLLLSEGKVSISPAQESTTTTATTSYSIKANTRQPLPDGGYAMYNLRLEGDTRRLMRQLRHLEE